MTRFTILTIVMTVMVGTTTANAGAIIYDNGSPDLVDDPNAIGSDFDIDPPSTINTQMADDFVLQAGSNTIRDIHWWGVYLFNDTPLTDDFTIRVFEDDGGKPSATNFQTIFTGDPGRTDTGLDLVSLSGVINATLYEYWVDVPGVTLTPGTTFWLSIVNNTFDDDDDSWNWVSSSTGGGGNAHERNLDTGPWSIHAPSTGGSEMAFNLTVPEPSTLALAAFGFLALAAWSRRRRFRWTG